MGKFWEQVRSGLIPGPLRRNFTPNRWNSAFSTAGNQDADDKRVYEAALVIHSKLEKIRASLKLSSSSKLTATTKLRAFVAGANYNYLVARTKTSAAFEKASEERARAGIKGYRPEQIAAGIKLELRGGFDWSPNEIVESLVDGIEVPVRFALQGNPSLAGNPRMNQVEWSEIALEINLGVMFRHAEDVWDECLWNGYQLVDSGSLKTFVPQQLDVVKAFIVGLTRRFTLAMGHQVLATQFHRDQMVRGMTPRLREVRAIEQRGKRQFLEISKSDEHSDAQEDLFIMRSFANEPYYFELLEEALPSLNGLALSDVLDAWMVISRAALILVQEMLETEEQSPPHPDRPAHAWLPKYAPVLQVDALVQALSSAAAIKPVDGRRLVEFFTFRGQPGQELWASPLVPVGTTTVAPVFGAVVSPNLRRLVDVWMRQTGIDLARRGPAFEAHLRASAVNAIASSKVLAGKAICIDDSYIFRPHAGREEEIDLLLVIGSTVVIGEAKCILEPTEPKGVSMHRRTVLGAAEQVKRKAQATADNRGEFVADLKRFGIELPQDFEVIPLVVVSTSTHVGIPVDGVAVIDEYILEKFLVGELEDVAVQGSGFKVLQRVKRIFYTDVSDAQAKAAEYFSRPPQVKGLLDALVGRLVPMHALDEEDWQGALLTLACEPAGEGLDISADS